ncbi:lectin c-type domain-containing protein [Phthorimaea operculella]|nr:lectin c-type domain-containing protein [Phthorimaea operculella]
MGVSNLVILFIVSSAVFANGQQDKKFFRSDYTYIDSLQSFYKLHTVFRTWEEANKRCLMEGANLFYAENEQEALEVVQFWNKTQAIDKIYVGITDLVLKDNFQTVDGKPISEVFSNWRLGEPNNQGGGENCVSLFRDRTLNDDACDNKQAFICKKELKDVQWSNECDLPRTDYALNQTLNRCYKFHNDVKNWTEAMTVCNAEQSYLAIINSQEEADFFVDLIAREKNESAIGLTLKGAVYLGFHDRLGNGWQTIQGQTLEEAGYSWSEGAGQPDGKGNETCGSMFYTGQLNDLGCFDRIFFICEHEIGAATPDIDPQIVQ